MPASAEHYENLFKIGARTIVGHMRVIKGGSFSPERERPEIDYTVVTATEDEQFSLDLYSFGMWATWTPEGIDLIGMVEDVTLGYLLPSYAIVKNPGLAEAIAYAPTTPAAFLDQSIPAEERLQKYTSEIDFSPLAAYVETHRGSLSMQLLQDLRSALERVMTRNYPRGDGTYFDLKSPLGPV